MIFALLAASRNIDRGNIQSNSWEATVAQHGGVDASYKINRIAFKNCHQKKKEKKRKNQTISPF